MNITDFVPIWNKDEHRRNDYQPMKLPDKIIRRNKKRECVKLPQTDKERIEALEKEIEKIKEVNNNYADLEIAEKYDKLHNKWLSLVGISITLVTIFIAVPTLYQVFMFESKYREIEDLAQTYRYVVLAEKSYSIDEKIKYYTSAIEREKDDSELYLLRAEEYFENGNYEMAMQDCSTVLSIDKGNINAYFLRGKIYFELGNYAQAIKDFEQYIPIYNEELHNIYMGYSYYCDEKYDEAIIYLELIEDNELYGEIIGTSKRKNLSSILSTCYLKVGRYNEAISVLEQLYDEYLLDRDKIYFIVDKLVEIYTDNNEPEKAEYFKTLLSEVEDETEKLDNGETIVLQGNSKYSWLKNEIRRVVSEAGEAE